MAKGLKKIQRQEREKYYLGLLRDKNYLPIMQAKCKFHYKDGKFNFYPTTGTYYIDDTYEKGRIEDLPKKDDMYYNLDKRYLPDWVFDEKRKELLEKITTQ